MANEGYSIEQMRSRGILTSIDGRYISKICREKSLELDLSENTIYKMIAWLVNHEYAERRKDGQNAYVTLTKKGKEANVV